MSGLLVATRTTFGEIAHRPGGLFGLCMVALLLIAVTVGPWLTPHDHATQQVTDRLQGPSISHPLGTDHLGRDLLARVVVGTRVALGVAVPAVLGALLLGSVLGLVAGYVGRRVDNLLIVVMDSLQAFPAVILALALLALLGPSLRNVVVVIAVAFAPGYARVVRALVLTLKQNAFVEAERALGASHLRIVLIHLVPNLVSPLMILVAMDLAAAITVEAGLSFLGVGVQPPTPSWGIILADGFGRIRETPWPVLAGGIAIMLTTLGLTMLGESLRDVLDPRGADLIKPDQK